MMGPAGARHHTLRAPLEGMEMGVCLEGKADEGAHAGRMGVWGIAVPPDFEGGGKVYKSDATRKFAGFL